LWANSKLPAVVDAYTFAALPTALLPLTLFDGGFIAVGLFCMLYGR
jgi:hypothetical protein